MRRLLVPLVIVAAFALGCLAGPTAAAPGDLRRSNPSGGNTALVPQIPGTPCWRVGNQVFRPDGTPISVCTAPATTTVAPTTSSSTTTTVPPTTPPSTGVQYVNTFDTAGSLDALDPWVFHRNIDIHDFWGFSGGTWTGDHDVNCGPPDTQRPLSFTPGDNQAERVANSMYWCPNGGGHFMTSMGDVDGYSMVTFSPDQVFADVTEVCVDVNLTDLGTRQWWKIGVVTDQLYRSTVNGVPGFLVSDVSASDTPGLVGSNRQIASWSGVGAYPAKLRIGNTVGPTSNPTPNDKMTRHPVCFTDNGDGTLTFTVAGVSMTRSGSFPAGPVRVVIYDHNYTPTKSESGYPQGFTWHWDNLIVR